MKSNKMIPVILTFVVTLAGVFFGAHLERQSAERLFFMTRKTEMRERAYGKLMGLRVPWTQAIYTVLKAKLVAEFYGARFVMFSHNREDRDEATKQNDRHFARIDKVSSLRREIAEALAEVRISYEIDEETHKYIEAIYRTTIGEIVSPNKDHVKTEADLQQWKDAGSRQIDEYVKEFSVPFDSLLLRLVAQLRRPQ